MKQWKKADFQRWRRQTGFELRRRRMLDKLTQAELAAATGLARTTIIAIEKGQLSITLDQLVLLADAFGVFPRELLPLDVMRVP